MALRLHRVWRHQGRDQECGQECECCGGETARCSGRNVPCKSGSHHFQPE